MRTKAEEHIGCLAEADLLLLLARWLQVPPKEESSHSPEDLRQLAAHCDLQADDTALLVELGGARDRVSIDDWIAEHNRLFEGGVSCPPNETAYIRRDKGSILADINGFYHAFGFDPAEEVGEKPDHVVTELQFAALLLVMAAQAAADGNADHESVTRCALTSFVEDHLGLWVDVFSNRLETVTRLSCFEDLGAMLDCAWRRVCERNGFRVQDHDPPVHEPSVEGTPYECDGCSST